MALDVRAKRAYDPADDGDGYRVLIDHVWPRGISRERARLDDWARELAPSDELRKWFDHDPGPLRRVSRALPRRARRPIRTPRRAASPRARSGPLTIVYAARDREHNNAVVLTELLRDG